MKIAQPPLKPCPCTHLSPEFLCEEIRAGRWVQEYRTLGDQDGEIVLVCTTCLGEWDHRVSDELILQVLGGRYAP